MFRASDVMTKELVTLSPDTTVGQAIRLLLQKKISGAPVVDNANTLLGIVSEYQLMEAIYDPDASKLLVKDVMSKSVLSVDTSAALAEVANLFIVHLIRRVPVLDNGRLVGLVARRDLLNYFVEAEQEFQDFVFDMRSFAKRAVHVH